MDDYRLTLKYVVWEGKKIQNMILCLSSVICSGLETEYKYSETELIYKVEQQFYRHK